jgi:acyl carrier protein
MDSVEKEVKSIVAEIAEIDPEEVVPGGTLADLGVDSLMSVEIAVFVERRFQVHFNDDELNTVRTFDDIVELTRAKVGVEQVA